MDERPQRRLAAVLSADVVGYSRYMHEDDAAALQALTARRKLVGDVVSLLRGRIVNAPGDSMLVEFPSVVDAVEAAVEIQRRCRADGGRMQLRIGVNLGDVLVDESGAIYGDGVNIAARLEALAVAGGVCVSKAVRDQVASRLRLEFEDLGDKTVKNIAAPVHAFQLRPGGAPAEAGSAPAAPRNSIAVLAFDNMTGDAGRQHFCDGISEDIITDLSKISGIAVVGRQSAFTYRGRANDLRQVARELGVRYVMEGSVRMSGSTVRVTAQLIEAQTGTHVWANRYDRPLDDVFLVGDEISEEIVTALDVKLGHGEEARIWRKALRTPQARDAFNRAMDLYYGATPQAMREARELFLEVTRLEPQSPWGYSQASVTHCLEVMNGWTPAPAVALAEARRLAERALSLDVTVPGGHGALGIVDLFEGRHDEALERIGHARSLRPACSTPNALLGYAQLYAGRVEEAFRNAAAAVELNPLFPLWYRYLMGAARHFGGRDNEALPLLQTVKQANPRLIFARTAIIDTAMSLGREEAASAEAAALLKERPDFSVGRFAATQPFQDESVRESYLSSLRHAGLPA
jgi:adenylate cyclase